MIALTSTALDASFVGGMWKAGANVTRAAYANRRVLKRVLEIGYTREIKQMRSTGNRMVRAFGQSGSIAAGSVVGAFDGKWIAESMVFDWDSVWDLVPVIGTYRDWQKTYECYFSG